MEHGWGGHALRTGVSPNWVGGRLGDGAKQERKELGKWEIGRGAGRGAVRRWRAPSWRHVGTQDVVEVRGPRTVEKGPLARVAVTGPQIGGLNCRDLISHSGARNLKPNCPRAELPLEAPGVGPTCLSQFLGAPASLVLGLHHYSLCHHLHPGISICVSFSCKDTLLDLGPPQSRMISSQYS